MSEISQPTVDPNLASTQSEKLVTEQKLSDSVSLLNEEEPKATEPKPEPKTEDKPKDVEAPGAPEKYSDFKLPDGVELSPEVVTEVSALFKEMNLSQTQAQKLVDFHSKTLEATAAAVSKTSIDAWLAQKATWRSEIKADPEIGGKLGEVKASIGKMYDTLGNPTLVKEFKAAMDLTGAGDNPAFIKLFNKLAERLGEGTPVTGDTPKPKPGSPAQALYPNLPSAG
jgi:hypothetical protein